MMSRSVSADVWICGEGWVQAGRALPQWQLEEQIGGTHAKRLPMDGL